MMRLDVLSSFDLVRGKHCGGRRKLIALITHGVVVRKMLDPLGLPTEPPIRARARVSQDLAFDVSGTLDSGLET